MLRGILSNSITTAAAICLLQTASAQEEAAASPYELISVARFGDRATAVIGLGEDKRRLVKLGGPLANTGYTLTEVDVNYVELTKDGDVIALDCKFTLDDSAIKRQQELSEKGSPDKLSGLEARGQAAGLKYIELDGSVGILANGAGLTMTSMDAITHYGGKPANFLEIGGEAYSLGREALELVLANPNVKSLLVNFCGAFARTDVMAGGIVEAWEKVQPTIPVFFTIHGTGEDEARAMVRDRLGIEPYELMDDAVKAAIAAAEDAA